MRSGAGVGQAHPQRNDPARKTGAGPIASVRHSGRAAAVEVRDSAVPIYGALDLGTNNCRLLLATPSEGSLRIVDAFSRIVRLGEGASQSGLLSEDAMARTISAVRVCANKLKWWRVERHRLIATEACRMARNGAEFIDRVQRATGIELEVIDRETEARMAVGGASALVDPPAQTVLIFDIGGGSTELMWVIRTGTGFEIASWTSVPVGVVTLAERYGGKEVAPESFQAMREHVRPQLSAFAAGLRDIDAAYAVPDHLLGTSGTVTTICGVQLGLKRYDRSKVDGCWLQNRDIGRVTAGLLAMSYRERAASPCIGRERADLVLAGCAILEEIRETWPAERVRVADRGLREGILTQLMHEDGVYGRP